jgi:replicative DNA helicase
MEAVIKRLMPHNVEAEQAVIGAMLVNNETIHVVSEIISGEDFYQKALGVLFDGIVELNQRGQGVDMVTLQEYLKEKDVPPEISGMEYMKEIMGDTYTSVNVQRYAGIVKEKKILRMLIQINEEITNDCYLQNQPLEEILQTTEKKVFELLEGGNTQTYLPIRDIVIKALERMDEVFKSEDGITGVRTGFDDLDRMLSGLQRSDLVLIAARPSMGKTAFALNIAQNASFRHDKVVAVFSLEMSNQQLMNRLFAMEGRVDAQRIRSSKQLKEEDWKKVIESAETIGKSNLIIDDTSGITVPQIRSKCRKIILEKGLDMVIIDYLQLMSASKSKGNENRQQEISEITRSLKGLARELNVPVVALSQLSRGPEQRQEKRPLLSDLRESGAIEQDADVCMFIYRDDYYKNDSDRKDIAEIIVAKQRNGPTGTIELAWIPKETRFANLAYDKFSR